MHNGCLVILFNIAEFEHACAIALGNGSCVAELLNHAGIRGEIPAAPPIDGSVTLADEVGVDGGVGICGGCGVGGVDEAEVEERALLLVNVGDELAAVTERAEAADGVFVVFALWGDELDEAGRGRERVQVGS